MKIVLVILIVLTLGCQTMDKSFTKDVKESSFFLYENSKIWYEDLGEGDTMLLIHGFASSSYTWRYLKEHYSSSHRVICLDLKGFGESSKPKDGNYLLEDQTKMVLQFIKEKNLNNITLVGHSFGGAISLASYIESKDGPYNPIKNLILINSAAYKQEIPGYINLLRTPLLNSIALNLIPNTINSEIILKELVYHDDVISKEMIDVYASFLRGDESQYALIETASNIIPPNIEKLSSQYKDIEIPVLIIWGDNDTVVDKSVGKRLHRDIAKSTFKSFKNCGHIPHVEYPKQTIKAIDEFLVFS